MVSLFLLLGCNLSYIVDLFAALHELASASTRKLLKLASSERALLKPYEDTLTRLPPLGMANEHSPSQSAILLIINQSISQSVNQSISQSVNQSISQSVNQSISQSVNQSISQSVNQSISQSVNQSISQSVNQSISQSVNQPFY